MEGKYRIHTLLGLVAALLLSGQIIAAPATAEIIRGPYLGNVTKMSIVISWETKKSSDSLVEYTTDEQYKSSGGLYDQRAEGQDNVKRHSVTLRELIPSAIYHYRVISGSDISEDATFHTAVHNSEPFTFAAYGDTRTNADDHRSVVDRIIEHEPHLVLNTGDLVYTGILLSQWDTFFDTIENLVKNVPYYPTLGNHENNAQHYYDLFYLPNGGGKENEQWYSFDYGNAHFVCLDSNVRDSSEQMAWLEADLAGISGETQWIFVFFHHPVYSSGGHGSEYSTMTEWIDILDRYRVDMVFNGHDHLYERSFDNGIWYMVTGGGGAPLYSVNQNPNPQQFYAESTLHFCKVHIEGPKLTCEMIRADGTVGDSVMIIKTSEIASVSKLPFVWGGIKAGAQNR